MWNVSTMSHDQEQTTYDLKLNPNSPFCLQIQHIRFKSYPRDIFSYVDVG
jgi:hypothetical protein